MLARRLNICMALLMVQTVNAVLLAPVLQRLPLLLASRLRNRHCFVTLGAEVLGLATVMLGVQHCIGRLHL